MKEVQTLVFRKTDTWAAVVTDGATTAMYGPKGRKYYASVKAAIAVLMAHGFSISMEEGWQ